MASIRARLLAKALPLTGLKAIFSDEAKLRANIAKARSKKVAAPGKALHRKFDVTETVKDGHPIFTLSPKIGKPSPDIIYSWRCLCSRYATRILDIVGRDGAPHGRRDCRALLSIDART